MPNLRKRVSEYLFRAENPYALAIFRFLLGVIFFIQFGRLEEYIVHTLPNSKFFLTYDFFHWVKIMPEKYMAVLFLLLKMASALVAIGLFFRYAVAFLFIGWTYIFLLCNGHYNNHYYLMSLITFLMIFTNADIVLSVKQLYRKKFKSTKEKVIEAIPKWQVFIFQFQIAVVYFFGALAKCQKDWLNGYPMKFWLPGKQIPFFSEFLYNPSVPYIVSYLGIITDFVLPFMLFSKKLRPYAFLFLIPFHVSNHFLWSIGIFPWFMLFGTIIYFSTPYGTPLFKKKTLSTVQPMFKAFTRKKVVVVGVAIFMTFQILFPLREFLYKGRSAWTGMGWEFAWHMMLIDKSFATKVRLEIPEENVSGYIDLLEYINPKQFKFMGYNPKNYVRFAHFIKDDMQENGLNSDVEIYVYTFKEHNGRPFQLLMDTNVNLVNYKVSPFKTPDVIMPFKDLPYDDNFSTITEEERALFNF